MDSLERLKIKISAMDFAVFLYIGSIILANGSILFYATTALLFACSVFYLIKGKLYRNGYLEWTLVFILFHALLIITGIAAYPSVSLERLEIVILNYLISIVLFLYMRLEDNRKKVMKAFIVFSVILILYGCLTDMHNILRGRFGDNTRYLFGLQGVNGIYMNSNDVGRTFSICILFIVILFGNQYHRARNKDYIFGLIIIAFTALTGSRAALAVSLGFLLLYYYMVSNTTSKRVKFLLIGFFGLIIGYYLIMNIPPLYAVIGQRIEILFTDTFKEKDYVTSMDGNSMYYRVMMFEQALSVFRQRPVLGWGLFAYSQMDNAGTYSHSNVMEMLVSGGVVGLILYYGGIIWLISKTVSERRKERTNKELSAILSILLVTTITSAVTMDFVNRLSLFEYVFVAALLADTNNSTKLSMN